ncbi:hypothetical protein QTP88_025724 [Uroleucon formosanum]
MNKCILNGGPPILKDINHSQIQKPKSCKPLSRLTQSYDRMVSTPIPNMRNNIEHISILTRIEHSRSEPQWAPQTFDYYVRCPHYHLGYPSEEWSNRNSGIIEDQEGSVKFKEFMTLFQKVEQESDIFKQYQDYINRVIDIKTVTANEAIKRPRNAGGIEKQILNGLHQYCSSHFSDSAAEKLSFQYIYSLHYEEYKDKKGKMIFNYLPFHKQFKVYVIPIGKYLRID